MKTIIEIDKRGSAGECFNFLLSAALPKKQYSDTKYEEILRYLYIDGDIGICSDGYRMHTLDGINNTGYNLEPGHYAIVKNYVNTAQLSPVKPEREYPDWRVIIPTHRPPDKEFTWETGESFPYCFCNLLYRFPEPTFTNFNFVEPLYKVKENWTCSWYGHDTQIKFECQRLNLMAVIMTITK